MMIMIYIFCLNQEVRPVCDMTNMKDCLTWSVGSRVDKTFALHAEVLGSIPNMAPIRIVSK